MHFFVGFFAWRLLTEAPQQGGKKPHLTISQDRSKMQPTLLRFVPFGSLPTYVSKADLYFTSKIICKHRVKKSNENAFFKKSSGSGSPSSLGGLLRGERGGGERGDGRKGTRLDTASSPSPSASVLVFAGGGGGRRLAKICRAKKESVSCVHLCGGDRLTCVIAQVLVAAALLARLVKLRIAAFTAKVCLTLLHWIWTDDNCAPHH